MICLGAAWEYDTHPTQFELHPAIDLSSVRIPSVMILNKEYRKLDQKLDFIRRNRIRLVFTAHHHYDKWRAQTGVRFVRFPFACEPRLFHDYGEPKIYDLGFAGALHERWTDLRARIKQRLFWKQLLLKFRNRVLFQKHLKRHPFRKLRIYWGEWNAGHKIGEQYARLINRSRIWLNTTSAIGLVGPRFYETMAAGSLLLCNWSTVYEGLFEEGKHCVMFAPDLSDFEDKLLYYLEHERERLEIVDRAGRHVFDHHTWNKRVEQFTEAVQAEIFHRTPSAVAVPAARGAM